MRCSDGLCSNVAHVKWHAGLSRPVLAGETAAQVMEEEAGGGVEEGELAAMLRRRLWRLGGADIASQAEEVLRAMEAAAGKPAVDLADICGWTALHWAAVEGNPVIAGLLIAGGASWEALDVEHCSPLHHAAALGRASLVSPPCPALWLSCPSAPLPLPILPLPPSSKVLPPHAGHADVVEVILEDMTARGTARLDRYDCWGATPLARSALAGPAASQPQIRRATVCVAATHPSYSF